jgi:hypothetical protein
MASAAICGKQSGRLSKMIRMHPEIEQMINRVVTSRIFTYQWGN